MEVNFTQTGTYDENLPIPSHLTLAQYTRIIFRPDAHFIEGEIVPRILGDYTHSRTIGELICQFHFPDSATQPDSCISLRLQISSTRIRVCDLAVLAPDAPREQVPTVPPILCVEVLAPNQTPSDELETLADYFAMGVPNIWLIDPIKRLAYTYGANGLRAADPTHLTVPGTPIEIDRTALFAKLDKKIAPAA